MRTTTDQNYCAVYDFGLFPYALGDVLTWNVLSAIRCESLARERVDAYICLDERHPASAFQQDLVTADNCGFNELFGAFGAHPRLGNVLVYRRREELIERLREVSSGDAANAEVLADYERALACRTQEPSVTMAYFRNHVSSHERINAFAAEHGRVPLLCSSMGCEPDVEGLLTKRFAGKRVVAVHVRLRRLDAGYAAAYTYWRDSDFLEWYEFFREAEKAYPDVQFMAVGRLQEKPLEMLNLPNVISLRALGLGLGHELSLILRSDLFIGTSSGFAAMVFFSRVPYFITKISPTACEAYRISPGSERLPFASERQVLVYEPETRELLMKLLERGLQGTAPRSGTPAPPSQATIDVRSWEWERSRWLHPGATSSRFFTDDNYTDKETAFLVWPRVREAISAWRRNSPEAAWAIVQRIDSSFPRMCEKFPEFLRLTANLAARRNEQNILGNCRQRLRILALQEKGLAGFTGMLKRRWHWGYPLIMRFRYLWMQVKFVWERKHRIPGKLAEIVVRLAQRRSAS